MRVCIKQKKKHFTFKQKIISILLAIISVFIILDINLRPIIVRRLKNIANNKCTEILNTELYSTLEKLNISYKDIAVIQRDFSGKITSVELNTAEINRFKSLFIISITNSLDKIEEYKFYVRLGSLLGPKILCGRGPKIPFKFSCSENVDGDISSKFEEAGINQTLHKIILDVTVNISCYLKGYSASQSIDTQIVLAETVIVGDVPLFYSG